MVQLLAKNCILVNGFVLGRMLHGRGCRPNWVKVILLRRCTTNNRTSAECKIDVTSDALLICAIMKDNWYLWT